ncbi:hypothetical protein Tco_0085200 [Tanacetum coccineum]
MVAYLEKIEGSEGFHQIIYFLTASHINYALTESPAIYASLIEQFWQTAALSTIEDGVMEITTTIDGRVKTITEASIRRHLKLEDSDGISTLPTAEIFEQLALMGVNTPLFQPMLVQDQGKGPTILVVSHHTPTSGPSTSQPPSTPPSIQTTPIAEEAAPMPHDLPLLMVYSLESDKGNLSLNELTERSLIEELDIDAKISLVPPHVADQGRLDDTQVSDQPKELLGVFGASKSEPLKKIKKRVQVQMSIDEELAQKVLEEEQARFNAEQEAEFKAEQEQERLDHETAMKIQEDLDAAKKTKNGSTDKDFVQQLQTCKKVSDEDLPRKLVELVNQRKKFFAKQRAKAKRNKPMTPAQQKEYMSTYIKNQEGGYTLKQLKALSFEDVKEIFEATMRKVQSFMPMDSELEVQILKRAGQDVVEEPAKRQRTRETLGSLQEQTVEEVYVEALQVKYLIIDWEIYFEDSRKYWKIIRVRGHTEAYQTFDDMLKKFNIDDLDKIWNLVKERFGTIKPTKDKERELWVELKRLFEPNDNDTL